MNNYEVGNIITLGKRHDNSDPIEWIVAHITEEGYGILITRDKYANMMFDNKEPDNPIEYRAKYGNNRWGVSNIRQWLNSDKPANEWYTPMHEYDAAPDYASQNGFLFNFSEEEKQIIIPKKNLQVVPSRDNDGATDVTVDTVWLPSYTEYFGSVNPGSNIKEGKQFEWFKTASNRNHDNVFYYPWMRSTSVGSLSLVCYVSSSLSSYGGSRACSNYGVRPAIMVKLI